MISESKEWTPRELMTARVERSVCAIKKRDMIDETPRLSSADPVQLDLWATTLLAVSGPKRGLSPENLAAFFDALPEVIQNLGTHGFKIPNPAVTTKPFFSNVVTTPRRQEGLISESLLPRSLIYSGNATPIRLAKFLMARLVLDDGETRVLDELLIGEKSVVVAALLRAGVPTEVPKAVSEAYRERARAVLDRIPVDPLTKQVFFEEEGKEDVIIIPIASEALISEMHQRSQKSDRWLASRALCAVGGANPVNGGALCSDLGGAFQLLMAVPPQSSDSTLLSRLRRGGPVYTRFSIRHEDIETFVRSAPLEVVVGNLGLRQREQRVYEWFATVLVTALLEAKDLYLTEPDMPVAQGGIGEYLRNLEGLVPEAVAEGAAMEIFDFVAKTQKQFRGHAADAKVRTYLIEMMTEELM